MDLSLKESLVRVPPPRPARTEEQENDIVLVPRPSNEITTTITSDRAQPARHRSRRSAANIRAVSQPHTTPDLFTSATSNMTNGGNSLTPRRTGRKGSLRNAVRRMFGIKPREEELQQSPPSRHGYHKSDPGTLAQIPEHEQQHEQHELQNDKTSPHGMPHRTLSAPLQLLDPPHLRRMRSPYAVEFPHSARLKPLELDNPFHKQKEMPARRRATLPSLVVNEHEAATLAKAIQARDRKPSDTPHEEEANIGIALTDSTMNSKRKSRSADDLKSIADLPHPFRERSEEIKYWRESHAGSVVRHVNPLPSEPVAPTTSDEEDVVTRQAQPVGEMQGSQDTVCDVGSRRSLLCDSPVFSRPGTAGDITSQDLEDRVCKLEHGLWSFKESLQQLNVAAITNTNRKTIVVDAEDEPVRGRNTPSILIHTFQDPAFNRKMSRSDSHQAQHALQHGQGLPQKPDPESPPPARTFTALYKIISNERSARRALEKEVQILQQDLSEIKYQLSQPIITRTSPSYMGSQAQPDYTRLQHQHNRDPSDASINFPVQGQRLTSRFSQSESVTSSEPARLRSGREHAAEGDGDMPTPHELYQTPSEERPRAHWGLAQHVDDGMF